jgi:hypothetical protein
MLETSKIDEIVAEVRSNAIGDVETLLTTLRKRGCTKGESIRILKRLMNIDGGKAKEIVHLSATWGDVRKRDDEFSGMVTKVLMEGDKVGENHD